MDEHLRKQEKAQASQASKKLAATQFAIKPDVRRSEGQSVQSPIQLDSTGAGTMVNEEDVVEVKPQQENPSAVVGTDSSVI